MCGVLVGSIGGVVPLKKRFTIGRGRGNDLPLNDARASRRHALITFARGTFWLHDRGSRFGTLVNGFRLAVPHALQEGDRLQWADTIMRYSANAARGRVAVRGDTAFVRRRSALEEFLARLRLTPREREVMLWMVQEGKTGPEIAILLGVKLCTVNKHLEHIYPKLGVENHVAAIRMLNEQRPPEPEPPSSPP